MDKRASEPSASTRATRRPLTEFIAPPAHSPVVELPRAKKPVEPQADADVPPVGETPVSMTESRADVPNEPGTMARQSERQEQPSGRSESPRGGWLRAVTAITSVATKAATDYRSWLTEHMKSAVGGAFGYASGLVSSSLPAGGQAVDPAARDDATRAGAAQDDPAGELAATACARAFEAMSANWTATLDYARRVAEVTSPADLILLSTSQARKQVDLLMEQSAALNALSRSIVAAHTDAAKNTAEKK